MPTLEDRANEILRSAEAAKGRILLSPGKVSNTAIIDESYIVIGNHLDANTIDKIERGDYVDFGRLVPKDQVLVEEDQRLEMVIRSGRTFYVRVSDVTAISSFNKWEQAFRVFSNIYTKANPHHSSELIEYNHVIHTISLCYIWDNVYLYDKDFRMHIAHNPEHNWSIILQQAWSLHLKDRINSNSSNNVSGTGGGYSPGDLKDKVNEPCKRYNRGKCSYGSSCHYDHRCSYCFKMGHSILTCRKLQADQECLVKYRDKNHKSSSNNNGHRHQSHHTDKQ